jgi:hypothetical protein
MNVHVEIDREKKKKGRGATLPHLHGDGRDLPKRLSLE